MPVIKPEFGLFEMPGQALHQQPKGAWQLVGAIFNQLRDSFGDVPDALQLARPVAGAGARLHANQARGQAGRRAGSQGTQPSAGALTAFLRAGLPCLLTPCS